MRRLLLALLLAVGFAACDGDDMGTPDAAGEADGAYHAPCEMDDDCPDGEVCSPFSATCQVLYD